MDKEIPKSELPKPFRKQSIRVSKSHLPGNTSYKGSVVWQRTLSIDDIAARVVDKRSEYRKETLVNSGSGSASSPASLSGQASGKPSSAPSSPLLITFIKSPGMVRLPSP